MVITILLITFAIQGIAKAVKDVLVFHSSKFETKFPNSNLNFWILWPPYSSWRNKYKNGSVSNGSKYFGSTTFLVWLTDGWHLFDSIFNIATYISFAIAFVYIGSIWIVPICLITRWLFFYLTFNIFFK